MSLKFGIYLVEQRIISPEQFCGLVKIQQDATMSLATIGIRSNLMTIKQVARVLNILEKSPERSFIQVAIDEKLIDQSDSQRLLHEQQLSCPSLNQLIVDCGLLTKHQTEVLFLNFEKQAAKGFREEVVKASQQPNQDPTSNPEESRASDVSYSPPKPKFHQRPVVVRPMSEQLQ